MIIFCITVETSYLLGVYRSRYLVGTQLLLQKFSRPRTNVFQDRLRLKDLNL